MPQHQTLVSHTVLLLVIKPPVHPVLIRLIWLAETAARFRMYALHSGKWSHCCSRLPLKAAFPVALAAVWLYTSPLERAAGILVV